MRTVSQYHRIGLLVISNLKITAQNGDMPKLDTTRSTCREESVAVILMGNPKAQQIMKKDYNDHLYIRTISISYSILAIRATIDKAYEPNSIFSVTPQGINS
eukprot:gene2434-4724_t